jgi:SAM-dependent methyltransferase
MLQPIVSVTHAHIAHVVASELANTNSGAEFRLLDVGCGNGQLLLALYRHLPALTGRSFHLSGFDVSDSRVQRSDFFSSTKLLLKEEAPNVDWSDRLRLTETDAPWPYADDSVDIVVTNQVLEHVRDLDHYMAELARVLKPGGFSINLFPVRNLFVEGHVGAPAAHRISSDDVRRSYLTCFARLGLARLGPMRRTRGLSPKTYGETRSTYVASQTAYRSFRQLAESAHSRDLSASYRWTPQFFGLKLGYVLGRETGWIYRRGRMSNLFDFLSFPFLSAVSSVTITFRNVKAYDPDAQHAGHYSSVG